MSVGEGCYEGVIKKLEQAGINFDLDSFRGYLSQGAAIYNGLTATVAVADTITPKQPADIKYGPLLQML